MIGAAQVAKMKPDAVIANVGRGEVIDEAALYAALAGWRIRGGIIDVWYSYPSKDDPNQWPARLPFQTPGTVLLSPRNSSWTQESRERGRTFVARPPESCAGRDRKTAE